MRRVGEWIFQVKPTRMTAELPPEWALLVLAVLGAAALWFHYGTAVFFEMIAAGISACF